MADNVSCILRSDGLTKLPIFTGSDSMCLDFNKIVPTPGTLNIECSKAAVLAIEAAMRAVYRSSKFADKWTAMPDATYKRLAAESGKSTDELEIMGLQYIGNAIHYRALTWYEWCDQHWGTSRNAYENERIDDDTIRFQTAYTPPIPVIRQLSYSFAEQEFEIWWAGEEPGVNTGYLDFLAGKTIGGDYISPYTQEAYENFMYCWENGWMCFEKASDGTWYHKDCEECKMC